MQEAYELHYGDSSVVIDDTTLCAYLAVVILMSIYSTLSIEEFYQMDVMEV